MAGRRAPTTACSSATQRRPCSSAAWTPGARTRSGCTCSRSAIHWWEILSIGPRVALRQDRWRASSARRCTPTVSAWCIRRAGRRCNGRRRFRRTCGSCCGMSRHEQEAGAPLRGDATDRDCRETPTVAVHKLRYRCGGVGMNAHGWIVPDWPAPRSVRALITTRAGGVSRGAYAGLNLGMRAGDDIEDVAHNRARLRQSLPAEPLWLRQVHGTIVAEADGMDGSPEAEAAVARRPGTVCAVLTADCLPLLLCDEEGAVVAAAHAGWRGLSSGVIEQTLRVMDRPPAALLAYLGPAVGPAVYEVGAEGG